MMTICLLVYFQLHFCVFQVNIAVNIILLLVFSLQDTICSFCLLFLYMIKPSVPGKDWMSEAV